MAITIKAFDADGDGVGLSFGGYLTAFDADFVRTGRGFFSDNPFDLAGDEFALSDSADATLPIADGQSFIADSGEGGELTYDFTTHTLGGTLDGVDFGTGLTYDADDDDFSSDYDVQISGLGLSGSDVNTVVADLMDGSTAELRAVLRASDILFEGGSGRDTMIGYFGDDTLLGGGGGDVLRADRGDDLVNGGEGNDFLWGGAGDDTIEGGAGNDRIFGRTGNDIIEGGAGNDVLTGESGRDTFVFEGVFGVDHITDFAAGRSAQDVISFSTELFADFADVLAHTTDVRGSAVIKLAGFGQVKLVGVSEADLHANDFSFF